MTDQIIEVSTKEKFNISCGPKYVSRNTKLEIFNQEENDITKIKGEREIKNK